MYENEIYKVVIRLRNWLFNGCKSGWFYREYKSRCIMY